jgi:hypothetical protein
MAAGVQCFAMASSNDIQAAGPECLNWNCSDATASLQALLKYVEQEAQKSIDWYYKNKRPKSFCSQWIQFLAVAFTAAAGLAPIIAPIFNIKVQGFNATLLPTLFVGLAAALLGLDKAFGFSSGWARYVMAATNIRKSLEEFRMDWAILISKACPSPTPEQVENLIQRAKEFRVTIEGIVMQETKDWVTEFQNNVAQLEKDVTAQLATLKAQTEKAAESKEAAVVPGSIQLTVPNADQADGAKIQVKLDGPASTIADESVTGSKTWVHLNVAPGQYRVTVSAIVNTKLVATTAVVIVKPGEIAQPSISLPI